MELWTQMRKTEVQNQFVKPGVAARILGLANNTVRAAVRRGDIPGITIGPRVLVSRVWLEELTTMVAQQKRAVIKR